MYVISESLQQDIFRQYCNSALEEQKLAVQEVQDIIDNLTRKTIISIVIMIVTVKYHQ